ncbi:MAG: DUF1501 domain-containing protein [Myxococcaceae bacterium]|nr:DUF1501 domain-containing protein [Myxococcaceae bacterium]
MTRRTKRAFQPGRRAVLRGIGVGAAALAFPHIWIPNKAYAQTAGRGAILHLLYIRLSGGFRFSAVFNSDVDAQFSPFGLSGQKAMGTEWGPSTLLERAPFLEGGDQVVATRKAMGMARVTEFTNEICVLPCVDHEPFSNRADGNHGTGLERFLTGYVGGSTSFLTYINYGLQDRGRLDWTSVALPAFSLGEAGMALGAGEYAAYRPPVMDGEGFERFGFNAEASLPAWAQQIAANADERLRSRLHPDLRTPVEAYQQSRKDTAAYGEIFRSDVLRVSDRSNTQVDGISNAELIQLLGDTAEGRRMALALRLFHFGSPAVFMNQGGYDMHSAEEQGLPGAIEQLNQLLSGVRAALKKMQHPSGGTYWDKTVVVLGSEFGRTTGGQKFNSAGGSDHSSDFATRWMSMPFMGGIIQAAGKGGRSLGRTRPSDLKADGPVYSYRSVLKTLMDWLGCNHQGIFPADAPIGDFFA